MRILVIGSGFIGTSIIQRLHGEGHEVLVVSRRINDDISCQQVVGDCFDIEDICKNLTWEPHVVIQTAWVTAHKKYLNDPQNAVYAKFTIDLASRLLESSVQHYLVLGSCAEYGPQKEPIVAGITQLRPTSAYAIQKVLAFQSARDLLSASNIRFTWARVFQPYGPNQDGNRLIPYLIKSLRNNEKIHLTDTVSILDWVTTRDIASAISWTIKNQTPTEIDIGTTIGYTNDELLQNLENFLETPLNLRQSSHIFPVNAIKVLVSGESPLFVSGWRPSDSLSSGLKWVLEA
jgi:nucleoside-diphosphate-sugar epimerase